MNIIIGYIQSIFSMIGPFFILLGILIFVHELGHFLVAKFYGVRVEIFSLGFGKRIFSYQKGDTAYCLSIIPLGGYVKMFGDDPNANIPEDQRHYSFLHKPLYQRFAVVLAGPLMNLFFAVFIFCFIIAFGEEVAGPKIGDVAESSAAYTDGLRSGDKILNINGEDTVTWMDIQTKLESAGGHVVHLLVERLGEAHPLPLEVPVVYGENENIFSSNRQVGQIPGLTQESRSTLVGISDVKSPAALAGINSLDLIVAINGKKVTFWRDLQGTLLERLTPETKTVSVSVRDVEKPDKPENVRTLAVNVREGWNAQTNLPEWFGLEPAELFIYQVKKDSPADHAGMLPKDKVLRVAGASITSWNDVLTRVKSFDPASAGLEFTVLRAGEEKTFTVKPEMTTLMSPKGQEEHRFTIGIVSGYSPVGADPVFYRITNPIKIVQHGVSETIYWTDFVVMSMLRLIQGEVSAKNIGGVISIGRVASHSFAVGLSTFLRMMGLISINLFLLNLLPIPILDGGHLVFYTIEGLRGTPLSMRKMEIAQQVGLMLLMMLMAFAFFNDISNLWSNRW
jgi:regulator of sigma E protease